MCEYLCDILLSFLTDWVETLLHFSRMRCWLAFLAKWPWVTDNNIITRPPQSRLCPWSRHVSNIWRCLEQRVQYSDKAHNRTYSFSIKTLLFVGIRTRAMVWISCLHLNLGCLSSKIFNWFIGTIQWGATWRIQIHVRASSPLLCVMFSPLEHLQTSATCLP